MRACASPNALTPRTSSHPRARLHPTHLHPCASTPLRVYTPVHIRPFALTPERIHPRVRFSLGNFPCGFQRPLLVPTSPTGSNLPCWFQPPLLVPTSPAGSDAGPASLLQGIPSIERRGVLIRLPRAAARVGRTLAGVIDACAAPDLGGQVVVDDGAVGKSEASIGYARGAGTRQPPSAGDTRGWRQPRTPGAMARRAWPVRSGACRARLRSESQ